MISLEPYNPGGTTRSLDNLGHPGYSIDLYGNVYNSRGPVLMQLDGRTWKAAMYTPDKKMYWSLIDRLGAQAFWDMPLEEITSLAPDIPKRMLSAIMEAKEFKMIPPNDRRYLRDIRYLKNYSDSKTGVYVVTRYGDVWNEVRLQRITPTVNRDGYRFVSVLHSDKYNRDKTNSYPIRLSHLVALAFVDLPNGFVGSPIGELEVHHLDHNPKNNRWDNLLWCTRDDHMNLYHSERPRSSK